MFQSKVIPSLAQHAPPDLGGNVLPFHANPNQSGKPKSEGTPEDAPKKQSPTVEYRFTSKILNGECPYVLGRQEGLYVDPDTTFYRWVEDGEGHRWQALKDAHLRGIVTSWLSTNIKTSLSADKVGSCIKVLRDLMIDQRRTLPPLDVGTDIVPLRNAYLLIDKQGVIRAVKPHAKYGQTYNIQADLDWDRVGDDGIYTPVEPTSGGYWHTYLSSTFTDTQVSEVAQEAFSMALLSQCYEKAVWMYGEGENGKSVMLHILRSLAPNATAAVFLNRLVKNEFGTNALIGKKIAVVSEMPRSLSAEIQGILKAFVSRDAVPGEFKGKDQFMFVPEATWFMASNHHPVMPEHEHGWWRKVITLPFLNRVSKEGKILNLDKLITTTPAEMIQVVDWLLIGGARLTERGRFLSDDEMPEAIRTLAQVQRSESDTVAAWVDDADPQLSDVAWTSKQAIYDHYRKHVIDGGRNPVAANAFWKRMAEHFRKEGFDTKGEQMTISGKRERFVLLSMVDIKPGRITLPKGESKMEIIHGSDFPNMAPEYQ